MMILAESKSGYHLLEYIQIPEEELAHSEACRPVTGSFAYIKCDGKYLIAYNKWRNQWEFSAGKIEEGETFRECAERELFEETNQKVSKLEYKGVFKVFDNKIGEIKYRTAFFAEVDGLAEFQENNEMSKIMLWDLKTEVGYVDEVDLEMLRLCLGSCE